MSAIPWSSAKDNLLLWGLQSAKGVVATTFESIPTEPNEQVIDFDPQWAWLQFGGGFRGKTHGFSKGMKVDGKLVIPAVPGYVLDPTSPLGLWLTQVQAAASYFQGYYATIIKGIVTGSDIYVEQYMDVKCSGGSIKFAYGNELGVLVEANMIGLDDPTTSDDDVPATWPSSGISEHLFSVTPWAFSEAAISLGYGGDPVASENLTDNHQLDWDMTLDVVNALSGQMAPVDAPNTEWPDWTGSFDKPWVDHNIRQAFLNGDECAYQAVLARGGGECTISMPRIKYTASPLNPATSGLNRQSGNAFQALASLSDKTADGMPCTITETAAS